MRSPVRIWVAAPPEVAAWFSPHRSNRYELDCSEEIFDAFWRSYLDLDEDYARIRARIDPKSDPFLSSPPSTRHPRLRQDQQRSLVTLIHLADKVFPYQKASVELLAEQCGEKRKRQPRRGLLCLPHARGRHGLESEEDSLHHLNAFPRDVWVNRVLAQEYPKGYPFEAYSPYNGIYQQYMFAWYRHRGEQA